MILLVYNFLKRPVFFVLALASCMHAYGQTIPACPGAVVIGNTDYDIIANDGNAGRLIYEWPDQSMAAVWMMGFNGPIFTDRGTGYNFFNGTWGAPPTVRLESVRTGFSNISGGYLNEELIFSHSSQGFLLMRRVNHGTGPWTETLLPQISLLWPRFAIGGSNGQMIHLLGNEQFQGSGQENPMYYWRSNDNGLSWNIQGITIPQLDSTNTRMTSPSKNISCRDSVVAIVTGGFTDDLILTKSTDNGDTWTNTIINQFPIPLYNQNSMLTDVNNDGIADTVTTTDRAASILIDHNHMVHIWVGYSRVLDEDIPADVGFFPFEGKLLYWNESMGPNTVINNIIAGLEDLNNDGIINLPVIGFPENSGGTSMPSAGINSMGHLFVTYAGFIEDTLNSNPPLQDAKRNVYVIKSVDNGQSWSPPLRICPEEFVKQQYPSMAETVYDDPRIVFFRDTSDNTALPPFHVQVVYVSPDISSAIPEHVIQEIQFNVWQVTQGNSIALTISGADQLKHATISVYDLVGRMIFKSAPTEIYRGVPSRFTLTPVSNGIYTICLDSEQFHGTRKLYIE